MSNHFSLEDKVILITGASSGIGKSTAQVLSELGAKVILTGRNEAKLLETNNTLCNPAIHCVESFDLNLVDEIPNWIKEVVSRRKLKLSGFVHAAGIHNTVPIRVVTRKSLDDLMNINVYAGISLLRGCSNKSVAYDGASFIFLSSVVGLVGQPGVIGYSASKGAITTAVKSAALELAPRKMRVNSIHPGIVSTEMTNHLFKTIPEDKQIAIRNKHPLDIGTPEDVAYAAAFLLSDVSKWVTGTSMVVDGGYTCQ